MSIPVSHAETARAAKRATAAAIGIEPTFIDALVERFYARVRSDALLGPVFAARVADWPPHLARMKAFWTSVLYDSGGFAGNPMLKHIAIPGIERAEFDRWLVLFGETLTEIERDPEATALVTRRARAIADSLLTGIRIHRDGRRTLSALKGLNHV